MGKFDLDCWLLLVLLHSSRRHPSISLETGLVLLRCPPPTVFEVAATDHGCVAIWELTTGLSKYWDHMYTLRFVGSGLSEDLGGRWQAMVVVTAARLWMIRLHGKTKTSTISIGEKMKGKSRSSIVDYLHYISVLHEAQGAMDCHPTQQVQSMSKYLSNDFLHSSRPKTPILRKKREYPPQPSTNSAESLLFNTMPSSNLS